MRLSFRTPSIILVCDRHVRYRESRRQPPRPRNHRRGRRPNTWQLSTAPQHQCPAREHVFGLTDANARTLNKGEGGGGAASKALSAYGRANENGKLRLGFIEDKKSSLFRTLFFCTSKSGASCAASKAPVHTRPALSPCLQFQHYLMMATGMTTSKVECLILHYLILKRLALRPVRTWRTFPLSSFSTLLDDRRQE